MDSKTAIAVLVIAAGVTTIIGSITGNLGGMLAALFDPADMPKATSAKTGGTSVGGILGDILKPGQIAGLIP